MLEIRSHDYLDDPGKKRYFNRRLFAEVASRYDFVTRALSFGRDQGWKRSLIAAFPYQLDNPRCVDLACGTGDVCLRLAERFPGADITGIDLSEEMLMLARQRSNIVGSLSAIDWRCEDMGDTSVEDASVDIVTGSYALRNAPELDLALTRKSHKIISLGVANS